MTRASRASRFRRARRATSFGLRRIATGALAGLTVIAWAPRLGSAATSAERAAHLVAAMTLEEKLALVRTRFGIPLHGKPTPDGALNSAGYALGIPRLGIPPLQESDAGLGIANPTNAPFDATAMPSGLALAATFDASLAERAGAAIGAEARAMGFSVLLAGGANLTRDPRGGRDFEYAGEDPLLTGTIVGAAIAGIQSNGIVSTLKHFALNAQENGRVVLNADLGEAAARESDLLAFELALERGHPGAVMTSYNRVDGTYASQNAHLLLDVLKGDWGFDGWVMSDWGGTHSTAAAANAGLDQESGSDLDPVPYFGATLADDIEAGRVPASRLDDMVFRILRARIAAGLLDDPPKPGPPEDLTAHAAVARTIAERGIVLLKNRGGVLPLAPGIANLLVVGAHADQGVLSGGGSSQVVPTGSIRYPGDPPGASWGKPKLYDPSSPLAALRRAIPGARVRYLDGQDAAAAARSARDADMAIVFADGWRNESRDTSDLSLPNAQDALIAQVAAANRKTVVVLETGGPVTMPWLETVAAVVEAWYPGERGGEAMAAVLTGRDDAAGRLPMTFPASEAQLPRPLGTDPAGTTSNPGEPINGKPFTVDYTIEGPDVGYKWFLRTGRKPLFPFGSGLSYAHFSTSQLTARDAAGALAVSVDVRNDSARAGFDAVQVYLDGAGFTRRLAAFQSVALAPGEMRRVAVRVDPRLTARYDVATDGWHVQAGRYVVAVRPDSFADGPEVSINLPARAWPARHGICGGGTVCSSLREFIP